MSKKLKVVAVTWVDSATNGGWVKPGMAYAGISNIESVGFLLYEDEDHIEISTSVSDSGNSVDILSIPKVAIVMRRKMQQ